MTAAYFGINVKGIVVTMYKRSRAHALTVSGISMQPLNHFSIFLGLTGAELVGLDGLFLTKISFSPNLLIKLSTVIIGIEKRYQPSLFHFQVII